MYVPVSRGRVHFLALWGRCASHARPACIPCHLAHPPVPIVVLAHIKHYQVNRHAWDVLLEHGAQEMEPQHVKHVLQVHAKTHAWAGNTIQKVLMGSHLWVLGVGSSVR